MRGANGCECRTIPTQRPPQQPPPRAHPLRLERAALLLDALQRRVERLPQRARLAARGHQLPARLGRGRLADAGRLSYRRLEAALQRIALGQQRHQLRRRLALRRLQALARLAGLSLEARRARQRLVQPRRGGGRARLRARLGARDGLRRLLARRAELPPQLVRLGQQLRAALLGALPRVGQLPPQRGRLGLGRVELLLRRARRGVRLPARRLQRALLLARLGRRRLGASQLRDLALMRRLCLGLARGRELARDARLVARRVGLGAQARLLLLRLQQKLRRQLAPLALDLRLRLGERALQRPRRGGGLLALLHERRRAVEARRLGALYEVVALRAPRRLGLAEAVALQLEVWAWGWGCCFGGCLIDSVAEVVAVRWLCTIVSLLCR